MDTNGVPTLAVADLTVSYRQGKGWSDVVRDVSLTIWQGQTYGLVGESGSGKTTLALAILNHLAEGGEIRKGMIHLSGRDLDSLSDQERQDVWRNHIKLVPQNPLSSLNPSIRIGKQLAEAVDGQASPQDVDERVLALLEMVDMPDPARVMQSYPHQLSGGMQQARHDRPRPQFQSRTAGAGRTHHQSRRDHRGDHSRSLHRFDSRAQHRGTFRLAQPGRDHADVRPGGCALRGNW